jgi:hypothetical protein
LDADDPTRAGVSLYFGWGRRAGQEKAAWIRAGIDGAPHEVPALGHVLPLIDEDWRVRVQQPRWIGASNAALRRLIECVNAGRPSARGRGLADAFGADDRYRGKRTRELLELGIYDPSQVLL